MRYYRVFWTIESTDHYSDPIHRLCDAKEYASEIGLDAVVLSY